MYTEAGGRGEEVEILNTTYIVYSSAYLLQLGSSKLMSSDISQVGVRKTLLHFHYNLASIKANHNDVALN